MLMVFDYKKCESNAKLTRFKKLILAFMIPSQEC